MFLKKSMKKLCCLQMTKAFIINKSLHEIKQKAERLFIKLKEWFSANKLTIYTDKSN